VTHEDVLLETLAKLWPGAVIGDFSGEERPSVWRYSEHFERLWEALDGEVPPWSQHGAGAVVIWDALPERVADELPAGRSALTPLSWAVCAGQGDSHPLRVWVLDLAPGEHAALPLYAQVRALGALPESRIRLVVPADFADDTQWDILRKGPEPANRGEGSATTTLLLAQLQAEMRRSPELDRHFVSNLLGPLLLLREMGREEPPDSGRRALLSLVRRLEGREFGEARDVAAGKSVDGHRSFLDDHELDCDLDVWLVDDQHQVGWGELVCTVLGVPYQPGHAPNAPFGIVLLGETTFRKNSRVRVRASHDPAFLVDLLETAFSGGSDGRFELQIDPELSEEGEDDRRRAEPILLLDLRLFSSRPPGDEVRHFGRVLAVARSLVGRDDVLGWPGFGEKELTDLGEWIEGLGGRDPVEWRSEASYLGAVSLLPRLLALADFSLPVILFSSTGQRKVIDRLARYRNVLTDFEKPRFFGYRDPDSLAVALQGLSRALDRACHLLAARRLCQALIATPNPQGVSQRANGSGACAHDHEKDGGAALHAELYLDESGDATRGQAMGVGGLAVVYPSEESVADFSQVLRDAGLAWGLHRDNPWEERPRTRMKKASGVADSAIGSGLERLYSLAKDNDLHVGAFHLTMKAGKFGLLSASGPDFVFRLLVRSMIELFLFDWLPHTADKLGRPVDAAIFAAQRVLFGGKQVSSLISAHNKFGIMVREAPWSKECGLVKLSQEAMRENWPALKENIAVLTDGSGVANSNDAAVTGTPSKNLIGYSFGSDSVYPLVTETFALRGQERTIHAALAVALTYYDQNRRVLATQLPRQIHYAADWIASKPDLVPDALWENGHRGLVDKEFEHLTLASRACDRPRTGEIALIEWERARLRRSQQTSNRSRWVSERLSRCPGLLTGDQFVALAGAIQLERVARRNEAAAQSPNERRSFSLFVRLSYRTSEEALKERFEQFGEILGVTILRDPETRMSHGIGFVNFASRTAAEQAKTQMNRQTIDDFQITVDWPSKKKGSGHRS